MVLESHWEMLTAWEKLNNEKSRHVKKKRVREFIYMLGFSDARRIDWGIGVSVVDMKSEKRLLV